jgi:hypothetical protein
MNKYAVISVDEFIREDVEGTYSIIDERESFVIIEYVTEPDPTNGYWVIFSGEGANVKCYEYLQTLEKNNESNTL